VLAMPPRRAAAADPSGAGVQMHMVTGSSSAAAFRRLTSGVPFSGSGASAGRTSSVGSATARETSTASTSSAASASSEQRPSGAGMQSALSVLRSLPREVQKNLELTAARVLREEAVAQEDIRAQQVQKAIESAKKDTLNAITQVVRLNAVGFKLVRRSRYSLVFTLSCVLF
jgi:hypothetical protein